MKLKQLCNNGSCEDIGNSHRCHCLEGYTGSYCQKEINECDSAPCQNGAVCKDLVGTYQCQCAKGFQGQNCELNVNDCLPNPCQNGGTCHDLINNFSCSCPFGTLGKICEINVNDCKLDACHNNGTCIDKVGGFECKCPPGFVGPRCEGDINECLSNPCSTPGTQDCVQLVNDYHCNCKPGFMGRHCDAKVNFCANSPCQSGGICTAIQGGHECLCNDGFYGKNCEYSGYVCDSNPCANGGYCRTSEINGYVCDCPSGLSGINCEVDSMNECLSNPCKHPEARCIDKPGDYLCYCPRQWTGKNCDIHDPHSRGGYGSPINGGFSNNNPSLTLQELDLAFQREQCVKLGCKEKQGNRHCDEECNTYACEFDGNDCSLGIPNPWANCTAPIKCWEVFMDGECNEVCNTQGCLFDGRDCQKSLQKCNPIYDAYCQKHYANGHCDYGCNNAECNWDGLDCENEPPYLADGVMSVILLMDIRTFKENSVAFLRDLGHQLRTTVLIKKDHLGNDMVYPWNGSSNLSLQDTEFGQKHNIVMTERGQSGVHVYLEIDNRKCTTISTSECFFSAQEAAEFLAATAQKHSLSPDFPIYQVKSVNPPEIVEPTNSKYVFIGVILVLLAGLLIGVLVTAQRKRAAGITWFPEGFISSNSSTRRRSRRRGPDGQEMRNLNKGSMAGIDIDVNGGHMGPPHWSDEDDDGVAPPRAKRARGPGDANGMPGGYASDHTAITDYEEANHDRNSIWTQQHLDAADIRVPPSMMTPPAIVCILPLTITCQVSIIHCLILNLFTLQHDHVDVDARGPLGMTPLMVAAVRGGGLDTGSDAEDEQTAHIISELVAQGAQLNAAMDKTGETSLHLAAR